MKKILLIMLLTGSLTACETTTSYTQYSNEICRTLYGNSLVSSRDMELNTRRDPVGYICKDDKGNVFGRLVKQTHVKLSLEKMKTWQNIRTTCFMSGMLTSTPNATRMTAKAMGKPELGEACLEARRFINY